MRSDETQKPAITKVKDDLSEGVELRESGNYVNSETLLLATYANSKVLEDEALIVESGNQLSIQYRLQAGRYARENDIVHAQKYSLKALDIYRDLEQAGLVDPEHYSTQRNYSHALLYSGFIVQAVQELQKSVELQPNDALKGDEMCHLASAYTDEETRDLEKALELVNTGIDLIEENKGSPIALTYGYMTRATIFSLKGQVAEITLDLQKALDIATERELGVRKEEISYLQGKAPESVHVLDVVSGSLRNERRNEEYGR